MTARPLVLFDATSIRMGSGMRGIGRFTLDLLYGLETTRAEWEAQLDIVALTDLGRGPRWSTTRDLRAAGEETTAARATHNDLYLLRRWLWLGPATRDARADLLFMPEARGVPPLLGVPRVVTCHDLIPLAHPEHYLSGSGLRLQQRRLMELRRYRGARRVVAISERTRRDVVTLLGVPPARVDVVPNGVDVARFADEGAKARDGERLRELGLGARPFVLYLGNGDWRKNVPTLFAAVAHAARTLDLEIAWAGVLEDYVKERVLRQAREAGVESRLRLLGFVADEVLPALYRGALAHVFLSRIEGFGLTAVEAMAAGCPVLLARGSGTDEVAGEAGFVVDADDARGAGDLLLQLAQQPASRSERVALGRARARVFGREHCARGYVQSFQRALADG